MKRSFFISFLLLCFGTSWGQTHRLHQENGDFFIFIVPNNSQKLVDFSSENKVPPYKLAALNRKEVADSIYKNKTIKFPILPSNLIKQANNSQRILVPIIARVESMEDLQHMQHQLQLSNFLLVNLNNVVEPEDLLDKEITIGYIQNAGVAGRNQNTTSNNNQNTTNPKRTRSNDRFIINENTKSNDRDHMLNDDLNHRIKDSFSNSLIIKDTLDIEDRLSDFGLIFEDEAKYGTILKENGAGVFYKSNTNTKSIYALYNFAPVGSIIKISNPSNGNTVYAKVIGKLPPTNQYKNAIIGISGNAGAALGAKDFRLFVQTYYIP